jgi:diguanylate cyclase (GGDEF)-like protein
MTQGTKTNILVVYDSISVCQAIIESLDDGHVTHQAANGEEAWKLLESTDTISIVFVDMNLPTMDSLLLLKKIRGAECQRIASLPVIIITRHESAESAKYASDTIGATGFISKPFDSIAISNLVNSYARVNKSTLENKKEVTYDKITDCLNETGFVEFCSRLLEYANFSYEDTSLLCVQLIGIDDVFKNLDERAIEQIMITIARHLNEACRTDEKVAYLGSGRFFIVLLTTNNFRAHIAGIRLQKKIASLKFKKDGNRIRVKAAIGISATDGSEDPHTYEVLRLQAENALQASLDLPESPVVRYDAAHEKGYDEELHLNQIQLKKA